MDDCKIWVGAKNSSGYGITSVNRKRMYAHRAEYEKHNGPIPDGMIVMHKCDNPSCINKEHLILGTQSDNIKDCIEKGRRASKKGEDNPRSVLTEESVRKIKVALRSPYRGLIKALAEEFAVDRSTIGQIKANKIWKHVKEEF